MNEITVTGELTEQSRTVVVRSKVTIKGTGEPIDKEYLSELLKDTAEAAVIEYEQLRPFAEAKTVRKQG